MAWADPGSGLCNASDAAAVPGSGQVSGGTTKILLDGDAIVKFK